MTNEESFTDILSTFEPSLEIDILIFDSRKYFSLPQENLMYFFSLYIEKEQ
jgi:hypothetical protein